MKNNGSKIEINKKNLTEFDGIYLIKVSKNKCIIDI